MGRDFKKENPQKKSRSLSRRDIEQANIKLKAEKANNKTKKQINHLRALNALRLLKTDSSDSEMENSNISIASAEEELFNTNTRMQEDIERGSKHARSPDNTSQSKRKIADPAPLFLECSRRTQIAKAGSTLLTINTANTIHSTPLVAPSNVRSQHIIEEENEAFKVYTLGPSATNTSNTTTHSSHSTVGITPIVASPLVEGNTKESTPVVTGMADGGTLRSDLYARSKPSTLHSYFSPLSSQTGHDSWTSSSLSPASHAPLTSAQRLEKRSQLKAALLTINTPILPAADPVPDATPTPTPAPPTPASPTPVPTFPPLLLTPRDLEDVKFSVSTTKNYTFTIHLSTDPTLGQNLLNQLAPAMQLTNIEDMALHVKAALARDAHYSVTLDNIIPKDLLTNDNQGGSGYTAVMQAKHFYSQKSPRWLNKSASFGMEQYESHGREETIKLWRHPHQTLLPEDELTIKAAMVALSNPCEYLTPSLRFNISWIMRSTKTIGFPLSIFVLVGTRMTLFFCSLFYDTAGPLSNNALGYNARLREGTPPNILAIWGTVFITFTPTNPIRHIEELEDLTDGTVALLGGLNPPPTEILRQHFADLTQVVVDRILTLSPPSHLQEQQREAHREQALEISSERVVSPYDRTHLCISNIRKEYAADRDMLILEINHIVAAGNYEVDPDRIVSACKGTLVNTGDRVGRTCSLFLPLNIIDPTDEYDIRVITTPRLNLTEGYIDATYFCTITYKVPHELLQSPLGIVRGGSLDAAAMLLYKRIIEHWAYRTYKIKICIFPFTLLHRIPAANPKERALRFDEEYTLAILPLTKADYSTFRSAIWGRTANATQTLLTITFEGVSFDLAPSADLLLQLRPYPNNDGAPTVLTNHNLFISTAAAPWDRDASLYDFLVEFFPTRMVRCIHRGQDLPELSSWLVIVNDPVSEALCSDIADGLNEGIIDEAYQCSVVTYSSHLPRVLDSPIFKHSPVISFSPTLPSRNGKKTKAPVDQIITTTKKTGRQAKQAKQASKQDTSSDSNTTTLTSMTYATVTANGGPGRGGADRGSAGRPRSGRGTSGREVVVVPNTPSTRDSGLSVIPHLGTTEDAIVERVSEQFKVTLNTLTSEFVALKTTVNTMGNFMFNGFDKMVAAQIDTSKMIAAQDAKFNTRFESLTSTTHHQLPTAPITPTPGPLPTAVEAVTETTPRTSW